ncbi:hypothetical protein M408DRAFT_324144 [Serendipita vermifera MAFF 305830]|uniref:Transmembrane protein n=1 Tax=Serendipita vermifera MAFF 305830 TaxID=933852 RepID=A0A0C3APT0_SERVB|nr:hypothetical protein M408DRAFT_324144 [Serendipita vermifera MAFF 305830]
MRFEAVQELSSLFDTTPKAAWYSLWSMLKCEKSRITKAFCFRPAWCLLFITAVAVLAYSVQTLAAPLPGLYEMEHLVARADEPGSDPASAIQQFLQASRRDITHPILPPPRINAPSSMLSHKTGVPLPPRVKKLNMPKKGGRAAIPKGSKGMKAAMKAHGRASKKQKSVGMRPKAARSAKANKLQTKTSRQSKLSSRKSKTTPKQKAAVGQKAKSPKKHAKRYAILGIEERDFGIDELD